MQGLSQSKHQHLIDALLHLESLLSSRQQECEGLPQTVALRLELEVMHNNYERLLVALSEQIREYEALCKQVKTQFLGKKLKMLKKQVPTDKPALRLLVKNIQWPMVPN